MKSIIILLVLFITNYVSTESSFKITPCQKDDNACLTKSMKDIVTHIMPGIPELGVEPLDPLNQDVVEGNLIELHYEANNFTVIGYKQCKIKEMNINWETSKFHTEFDCPKLTTGSKYRIVGLIIVLHVNGSGEVEGFFGETQVTLDADIKKVQGPDGKNHIQFENLKVKSNPIGQVKYNLKNLFQDNEILTEAANAFINENWKELTLFWQDPLWNTMYGKMLKIVNTYMMTVPYEDIIKD